MSAVGACLVWVRDAQGDGRACNHQATDHEGQYADAKCTACEAEGVQPRRFVSLKDHQSGYDHGYMPEGPQPTDEQVSLRALAKQQTQEEQAA